MELVLERLGLKSKRRGMVDEQHLRQHAKSTEKWEQLEARQKEFDFIVFDAQFGLRHGGRSVYEARKGYMPNEFDIGVFTGLIMNLTHPERERRTDQLHQYFAGDDYEEHPEFYIVPFGNAPIYHCRDGKRLAFGSRHKGFPNEMFGSVTTFVPE